MKKVKIKTVKPDSMTTINVSGSFLKILEGMLTRMLSKMNEEEALKIYADIHDSHDDMELMSDDSKDIYILMSLIKTIEVSFTEEGKVKEEEIEYDPIS